MSFPAGRYTAIYADPPWAYAQKGGPKGQRGMATAHYSSMATEEICALPVRSICCDDAILFLWATGPNMQEALKVMSAWGFTYKGVAFTWVKTYAKSGKLFWGMGAYTRANAEFCLLGTSKKTKAMQQVKSHGVHSVVMAPAGIHSAKPPEVRERIEQLLGDVPRIELFARERVPGWNAWGNEV